MHNEGSVTQVQAACHPLSLECHQCRIHSMERAWARVRGRRRACTPATLCPSRPGSGEMSVLWCVASCCGVWRGVVMALEASPHGRCFAPHVFRPIIELTAACYTYVHVAYTHGGGGSPRLQMAQHIPRALSVWAVKTLLKIFASVTARYGTAQCDLTRYDAGGPAQTQAHAHAQRDPQPEPQTEGNTTQRNATQHNAFRSPHHTRTNTKGTETVHNAPAPHTTRKHTTNTRPQHTTNANAQTQKMVESNRRGGGGVPKGKTKGFVPPR